MKTIKFAERLGHTEMGCIWRRVLAFCLDLAVLHTVPVLLWALARPSSIWLAALTDTVFAAYFSVSCVRWGQTLGQRIFQVRVVSTEGARTAASKVVRELIFHLNAIASWFVLLSVQGGYIDSPTRLHVLSGQGVALLLLVDGSFVFFSRDRRMLHDALASTRVERESLNPARGKAAILSAGIVLLGVGCELMLFAGEFTSLLGLLVLSVVALCCAILGGVLSTRRQGRRTVVRAVVQEKGSYASAEGGHPNAKETIVGETREQKYQEPLIDSSAASDSGDDDQTDGDGAEDESSDQNK